MDWKWYVSHETEVENGIRLTRQRLRLTGDDAGDFAQDARVFIARNGHRIFPAFRQRSSLKTYIARVIWRFGLDRSAAKKREKLRLDAVKMETQGLRAEPWHPRLTRDLSLAATAKAASWIRSLRPSDREQILRRFVHGEGVAQIAIQLGTTPSAAFKRLYRLLAAARKDLMEAGVSADNCDTICDWLHNADADFLRRAAETAESRQRTVRPPLMDESCKSPRRSKTQPAH